jgi:hypothetical protein
VHKFAGMSRRTVPKISGWVIGGSCLDERIP